MLARIFVIALLSLPAGCQFSADRALSPGQIRAHVVYATDVGTALPAVGARVALEGSTVTATTDSNGDFVLLNLPPGTFAIDITASSAGGAVDSGLRLQDIVLTPTSSGLANGVDLGTIQIGAFGSIIGSVTLSGAPAPGAVVVLSGITQTNAATGAFTFSNILPGSYGVAAFARTGGATYATSPQTVKVPPRQAVQVGAIDLGMPVTYGNIAGTVQLADTSSARSVAVQPSSPGIEGLPSVTPSDAEGDYVETDVPPGIYTVTASSPGYAPVSVSFLVVGRDTTTVPAITLSPETDGGTSPTDAGPIDAGPIDAGPIDAGTITSFGACNCNPTSGCTGPADAGSWSTCPVAAICDLSDECVTPHYTVNGDGTVTDDITGLIWQMTPSANPCPSYGDGCLFSGAQSYCTSLSLGAESSGWRLPTLAELFSIVDTTGVTTAPVPPAIDSAAFPTTFPVSEPFWTSTPSADGDWLVNSGPGNTVSAAGSGFVRCVWSGLPAADGGTLDAGAADAGAIDAGAIDAGSTVEGTCSCQTTNPDISGCGGSGGMACPRETICELFDLSDPESSWNGSCYAPQYTDNGNGTVTDHVTGLVWQQQVPAEPCPADADLDAGLADTCNWGDAVAYCQSLSLAGYTWRLPTLAELFSLVDMGNQPTIDPTYFTLPGGADTVFWSSSPCVQDPNPAMDTAWAVFFSSGEAGTDFETGSAAAVRCVAAASQADAGSPVDAGVDAGAIDAGACSCQTTNTSDFGCTGPRSTDEASACPLATICDLSDLSSAEPSWNGSCVPPQYTDNGNGTVTDGVTGLTWQQTAPTDPCPADDNPDAGITGICSWNDAQTYCQSLSLGGTSSGWRLPTLAELFSLMYASDNPLIDTAVFSLGSGGWTSFWSSSTGVVNPTQPTDDTAWTVSFSEGAAGTAFTTPGVSAATVRCVR